MSDAEISLGRGAIGGGRAALPRPLSVFFSLFLGVSFLVFKEPAPCDLLFPLLLVYTVLFGHAVSMRELSPVVIASIVVFLVTNLLPLFWTWETVYGVRFFAITAYLFASFVLLALTIGRYGPALVDVIIRAIVFAATTSALIGIAARFQLLPNSQMFFRDESGKRIKSTFKDPNVFGPFLVVAMILILAQVVESKKVKAPSFVILLILTTGVLLTFSRGAWANLLLTLAVYVALQFVVIRDPRALRKLTTATTVFCVLAIPALLVIFATTDIGDYFQQRLALQDYDQKRFGAHAQAIETAKEQPFGIGPGQFKNPRFPIATHQLYLRILVENGVLGLISFVVFALFALSSAWRGILARDANSNLHAACLALSVGILGESSIIDTLHWRHFFWVLAIPVGLEIHDRLAKSRGKADAEIRA